MDTQKLIRDAKARFKYHESKIYLQEKYRNRLTFANQGGMWTVTPEFLGFLASAPEETVITDDYGNPIKVKTSILKDESWKLYNTIMGEWHAEYINLANLR